MRIDRIRIWIIAILGALAVAITAVRPAAAREEFSGGLGLGYCRTSPGAIADIYGGTISFDGGVELRYRKILIGLDAGFRHASGTPDRSFLIEDAEATLTEIPVDLTARFPFAPREIWAPYAGLGFEALWLRESFRYRLDGDEHERTPNSSVHPGGVLVLGMDRVPSPHLRFEAFYSYVPVRRVRAGMGSTYEADGAEDVNAGGYGVRLTWRLP